MSKSNISTREYEHPQWGNVIHLANKEIEAIIAPERGGRLMHYSRLGESNLLWTAADINSGQGDVYGWKNWGGEKTWLWPLNQWPPPLDVEQAAYRVNVPKMVPGNTHGIRLVVMVAQREGRLVRVIEFPEEGNAISIDAWLGTNSSSSVWSVTQIPVPETIVLERAEPHRFLAQTPDSENPLVMLDGNTIDLAATVGGTKGMMDADAFRVPTAQGILVVRQSGIPGIPYEDVYRAQVYKSVERDGDAYVELEFAAPLPPPPPALNTSHQRVTLSLE